MSVAAPLQAVPARPQAALTSAARGVLRSKCACGAAAGFSGACSECQSKRRSGLPVQTKPHINEPGDEYEQEADRVAEQVMRMPGRKANIDDCKPQTPALVQRRVSMPGSGTGEAPSIVNEVLSAPGQPLDSALRNFFEPRFGHDFAEVRVHSDARAAESARAVNALAYTSGSNIVFGAGQYMPGTNVGRRLLAHELTHVVQQSRVATVPAPDVTHLPNGATEGAAETPMRRITGNRVAPAAAPIRSAAGGQIIQRKLRVDDPQTQAKTPMESPYIVFQDALARICDRIVMFIADDLVMEKWPLQRPRAIERFVRRAMDSRRVYRLRLGATDLGGRQVRGASWELQGNDVVLTFNPAHHGKFTWTVDELLAQQIVSAVAANDPEEIPSLGTEHVGTMEELMTISSVDYMLTARLPYGSTDNTKPEEIRKLQTKTFTAVRDYVNESNEFRHLTPRQRNALLVGVAQADGVTLLEIIHGVETNSRYRVVERRQGDRVVVTYKDPSLTGSASAAEIMVTAHRATFVPGADTSAGPVQLPMTGGAGQCSNEQNRNADNSCCTNAMLDEIRGHLQMARTHTQRAIARLETGSGVDCYLRRNFGGKVTNQSRHDIVNRLRIVLSELYLSRHAWKCREKGSGFLGCVKRDRGTVGGRVEMKDVVVLLCVNERPSYTDWISVLHEIVHRTGIFGEELYKGESAYPGKNAMQNADSYARLVEDLGAANWKPCGSN